MIIAAVRDDAYNVVLVLHILAVLAAFAPAFVHPLLGTQMEREGGGALTATMRNMHRNGQRVYAPALILVGVLGLALSGMSDKVYGFGDTWVWLSALLWVALNGVLHAVLLPAEKAVADGDASAATRVQLGGAIMSVLGVIVVVLMIFKPGS
jgi:uncharacterized membrane protein